MYKNVIFDLYGTLVDICTDENKSSLWKHMSMFFSFSGAVYKPRELKNAYLSEAGRLTAECGCEHPDIDIANVFLALYKSKGISATNETVELTARIFRILSTKYIRVYDGADELLELLRKNGKKVYLLTNAQRLFTVPELTALDLIDKFDGIVISSDIKRCKPDSLMFETLIDTYGLIKRECIMVGNDAEADIRGSYLSGIDSIYVRSNLSPNIEPAFAKYKTDIGSIRSIADLIV